MRKMAMTMACAGLLSLLPGCANKPVKEEERPRDVPNHRLYDPQEEIEKKDDLIVKVYANAYIPKETIGRSV